MHNEKVELDYNCGTETLFLPGCLGLPPHHATSAPPVEKSACRTPFLLTIPAKKGIKQVKLFYCRWQRILKWPTRSIFLRLIAQI